jgi:hypothetical protein
VANVPLGTPIDPAYRLTCNGVTYEIQGDNAASSYLTSLAVRLRKL